MPREATTCSEPSSRQAAKRSAREEMCIGVYESFVTFHPNHVNHFLHTDDAEGAALGIATAEVATICQVQP